MACTEDLLQKLQEEDVHGLWKTVRGCHGPTQSAICCSPTSAAAAAAVKSLQSCPTLSDPMDCSLPGSSIHGIFQTRVLEWGAIAFSAPTSTCLKLSTIKSEKRKHSTVKTDTTLHSWFTVKQQVHISFSSQFLPETRGLRECCPILDILKGEPTPLGPASTAHTGTEKLLWNERF